MLNSRLLACANFVQGNFICDVGTDHAFLPIYLVQNRIAERAVASDVRKGPLQAAEQNILKAGLSDKLPEWAVKLSYIFWKVVRFL